MKEFNLKITFTDRESYLAWRKQWATDYAEISQTITDLKFCRKTELTEAQAARQEKIRNRKHLHGAYGFNLYGCLWHYKAAATTYMALLEAAKVVACKQWEAAHPDLAKASQEKRETDQAAKVIRIKEKIAANKAEQAARREAFKSKEAASA